MKLTNTKIAIIISFIFLVTGISLLTYIFVNTPGYKTTTAVKESFTSCSAETKDKDHKSEGNVCTATYIYEVNDTKYLAVTKDMKLSDSIFPDTVLIRYNPNTPNNSKIIIGVPYLILLGLVIILITIINKIVKAIQHQMSLKYVKPVY